MNFRTLVFKDLIPLSKCRTGSVSLQVSRGSDWIRCGASKAAGVTWLSGEMTVRTLSNFHHQVS